MYVDVHKDASDVRDEFVSVTEKLMDELAQCYNVLPQLDINNTIDHRPEGDEKWFLENEKTVTQFCRKLAAERPLKDIRDEYNYPKKIGIRDECSRLLEASTMKSRRGFAIQRLMNAMRQAHADGWFFFFDTLTLADDRYLSIRQQRQMCISDNNNSWHKPIPNPGFSNKMAGAGGILLQFLSQMPHINTQIVAVFDRVWSPHLIE